MRLFKGVCLSVTSSVKQGLLLVVTHGLMRLFSINFIFSDRFVFAKFRLTAEPCVTMGLGVGLFNVKQLIDELYLWFSTCDK